MRVDGRDVLLLAGANYLDLAADPRVLAGAHAALDAFGAASGGARLISGNLSIHEELERELAAFLDREAALLFSTGYMANLGVLTALAGEGDAIVSDALNHASIIDACRLSGARTHRFRHNDPEDFAHVASRLPAGGRRLLVLDGVYSMDGDVAALGALVPIAREHDMLVVLDDAHGIGVLGERGRGAAELAGVEVDIVIGNLGKALGSFGAFAACSATLREWLVQRARSFVFTCALAPAAAGAAQAALRVIQDEPERRSALLARAARLRGGLEKAGFDTAPSSTHIVPALIGENRRAMRLCERALERGVYAQGIRYPSVPRGRARLRLTPMCSHTEPEIDAVVELLAELRAEEREWAT
jgi:8-amino-7-oxononanoate synthase